MIRKIHKIHLLLNLFNTEWPKKVSHYQVSSLNRIKTAIKAKFSSIWTIK